MSLLSMLFGNKPKTAHLAKERLQLIIAHERDGGGSSANFLPDLQRELIDSVKAGVGVGPLPMPLGDAEPDLVRVIDSVPELSRIWRLLTTPELRRTPRVSAFFDFIVEEIDTLRPILTG